MMADLDSCSRSLIINTNSVADMVSMGRDLSNVERAEVSRLIRLLMRGLDSAVEDGFPSELLQVWASPDFGEGALYKCVAREYSRIVELEFDVFNLKAAGFESDIEGLRSRFVPGVLSVPIHNAAYEKKILIDNDPPMIFAYGLLYKGVCNASMSVSWDLRRRYDPWYTYEGVVGVDADPLEVMARFQDHSLEPRSWILDVPVSFELMSALVAAAHIDGREHVSVSFAFPDIWLPVPVDMDDGDIDDVVYPDSYDLLWVDDTVLGVVGDIGSVEGNINIVLGLEVLGWPLSMFKEGVIDEEFASMVIGRRIGVVAEVFGLRG